MVGNRIELSDKEFEIFQKLIYEKSRIFLKPTKRMLLINRLNKRLRENNLSSFTEYYDLVAKNNFNNPEYQSLLDAITTNKTDFFRESKQWQFLEKEYWPALKKSANSLPNKTLRIWSSACSSGEEPYSIAIHFLENIPSHLGIRLEITASDISEKVLSVAREGIYGEEKLGPVKSYLLPKYFLKGNNRYKVKDPIKKMIDFRNINLIHPFKWVTKPFDIIFCRNVIIYFDKKTQAELMEKYFQILKPGGYLILGHSESLNQICDKFEFVTASIYKKQITQ